MSAFFTFWWDCLVRGARFGDGIFAIAEFVAAFVWVRHRKRGAESVRDADDKVKKWARITFLGMFSFTTLLYAPYEKYEEARRSTGEIKHDIPYDVLTNQLKDATDRAEKEKTRADQEHNGLENEKHRADGLEARYVEALSATNTYPSTDTISDELAILQHEQSLISPTNADYFHQIYENKRLTGMLETKSARANNVTTFRNHFAPNYPLWVMAYTSFRAKLDSYTNTFGGAVKSDAFPTLDDLVHKGAANTELNVIVGTNRTWNGLCLIGVGIGGDQTELDFTFQGSNALPAKLMFSIPRNDDTRLHVYLDSDNIEILSTNCSLGSKSDCLKLIDSALDMMIKEQKGEFGNEGK